MAACRDANCAAFDGAETGQLPEIRFDEATCATLETRLRLRPSNVREIARIPLNAANQIKSMQGEKIAEESGKITAQRVLANPGGPPKMETSFRASTTLLGVKGRAIGTYWSVVRPDGTLYGEGQGVLTGEDGHMATWIGQGVGTIKKDGSASFRGAVFYQTSSPKWLRLNSVAAIFEHEVDTQGNIRNDFWEWK
jgi:hypothetical protein